MLRIVQTAFALCLAAPLAACPAFDITPLALEAGPDTAEPSLAASGHDVVLTWQARLDDGVAALRFQRFDAEGRALDRGEITRGDGWFLNWADFPALQVLDNGDWLAHWLQRSGTGRYSYDIRSVRSRNRGATWSSPFTLHDDGTQSEHGFVAYAPAGDDAAWVAWLDGRHTVAAQQADSEHGGDAAHHGHGAGAGAMSLRVARLDRGGVSAAQVLDDRVCDCCQVDAARVGNSTLVIYRDRSDDEVRDISLARHDGRRWHPSQPLFADGWRIAGCPVNGPAIAAHGRHVVAAAYSEAGGQPVVQLRTSSDAGVNWQPAVTVAAGDTLGRLDVLALDNGRFVLSRIDSVAGNAVLRLSLHGADGKRVQQQDLATLPEGRLSGFPRMAALGATVFVAWTEAVASRPQVRAARVEPVGCHNGKS